VRSDAWALTNQALQLTGTFRIGGAASRSVTEKSLLPGRWTASAQPNHQRQTRTEIRQILCGNPANRLRAWQFRVVDEKARRFPSRATTSATSYTSGWQNIPAGGGAIDPAAAW
jgi:hypothetical protein